MVLGGNRWGAGIDDKTNESKLWEQTKVSVRLFLTYFNWKLDVVAFVLGNYGGSTSRFSQMSLDLE